MRHPFHALCPYFAMFPETFVQRHLVWTGKDDIVLDPFSGRGTTVFESLLRGRKAIGCDINPVAVCVSNAKADPPTLRNLLERIRALADSWTNRPVRLERDPFFRLCFHRKTLRQLEYLRSALDWRVSRTDRFIAALILGSLHGESHRSERYFSNRMPRTISTKPKYSVEWWKKFGYVAPERDVFKILEMVAVSRFLVPPARIRGRVAETDARFAATRLKSYRNKVKAVITSPPYLDTTNFEEDQWLRLWFLGGTPYVSRNIGGDDRHTSKTNYWQFLTEAWGGIAPLLRDDTHIVIRIGGKRLTRSEALGGLRHSLEVGLDTRIKLVGDRTSSIEKNQRRTFQPNGSSAHTEYDFHFVIA